MKESPGPLRTCVVTVKVQNYSGLVMLSAEFDQYYRGKQVSKNSCTLLTLDGQFAFTVAAGYDQCEYRIANGDLLRESRRESGEHSVNVYMEPAQLLACLGEERAGAVAALELKHSANGSWVTLFRLLGTSRAVSMAIRNPELARYLSPEAAALYAEENSMLAESWRLL